MSLPAWERGLKRGKSDKEIQRMMSLPAWERGLKLKACREEEEEEGRSPRGSVD